MDPGVVFELIWEEDDLLEIRVFASNGRFHACTDCYTSRGEFARLADEMAGFPNSLEDTRTAEFGILDPAKAYGGVRLSLRCSDSAGHVLVDLEFQSRPVSDRMQSETASFSIPIEPASIDRFVEQLRQFTGMIGDAARLDAEHVPRPISSGNLY